MSYSNITKQAYAKALRELMQEMPFEKITIAQICEKYGMSRKSFYYHFKDKYDLVTWIFDENYVSLLKKQSTETWDFFETLCSYLYDNRDFYQKVLKIQGQNSFSEHLEEFLSPIIKSQLQVIMGSEDIPDICIDFVADGLVCSIKRWLLDKDCMPAEQFISIIKSLIENIAASYSR